MKTTNIFIDFIVVGTIGIAAFAIPICMIWGDVIYTIFNNTNILINLTPVLTVITYAFGVFFNQIADRIGDIIHRLPWLRHVLEKRQSFQDDFGATDHHCIQYIVTKSAEAYEYLSFRRAVVRIIRSVMAAQLLVFLLHLVVSFAASTVTQTAFSLTNTIILILDILILPFTLFILRKLEIGYFLAAKSFYTTLHEDQA